jgi:hypothetical protein
MSSRYVACQVWAGLIVALAAATPAAAQGKKAPPPPPNWPCEITFRATDGDASTDKIKGDGLGAYRDGVAGVSCRINQSGGHVGSLFVNSSGGSPRALVFPSNLAIVASPRTAYGAFENRQPGYLEIYDVQSVVALGVPALRTFRVGVGSSSQFDGGEFWGDGSATDALTSGSHSATVVATGPCSWTVRWEAGEGTPRVMALNEGHPRRRQRTGDFQLPFEASVVVTGVKAGCPAP